MNHSDLTFVSISPDRSSVSPVASRMRLYQSVEKDRWEGVSPETVGQPQGLKNRVGAGNEFAWNQEVKCRQLLTEVTQTPESRPPLLHFLPVKDTQLITEPVTSHTYSKGNFLQDHPLLYRVYNTESRLVRSILELSGFYSTDSHDWNVFWVNSTPLDYLYKGLNEFQRINHFPCTSEITRKDRLLVSIRNVQKRVGTKEYKFIPETFILPQELTEFQTRYQAKKCVWISKPCASSQGRGISLIDAVNAVLPTEACVVSRYISNPALVNGLKFDLRIYVLVSCYCPLRIYIYEEGLARFACEHFQSAETSKSKFVHLTNYSINKKSELFQQNQDYRQDNIGHKWSLSALFKHLETQGHDLQLLWAKIYDLVIKTIIAAEEQNVSAGKRLGLHRNNCFDLLGFDVLLDDTLKPWLLEVNLSPSLAIDSPLDLFVKANLVADTFNLIGIRAFNRKNVGASKIRARLRAQQPGKSPRKETPEVRSAQKHREMLIDTLEEHQRRGHFLRIYPAYRCEVYDHLFTCVRTENKWLYSILFQGKYPLLPEPQGKESSISPFLSSTFDLSSSDFPKHQRQNLSIATEPTFLPLIENSVHKSRKGAEKLVLKDVLVEYLSQVSDAVKDHPDAVGSQDWKMCLESFGEKMNWLDLKPGSDNLALGQRLRKKVTELAKRKSLENIYGKAKTREESHWEDRKRQILTHASPRKLERMLKNSGGSSVHRAVACLFDKKGRGVLVNLLRGTKEHPRSHSCLHTDQGEGDDAHGEHFQK